MLSVVHEKNLLVLDQNNQASTRYHGHTVNGACSVLHSKLLPTVDWNVKPCPQHPSNTMSMVHNESPIPNAEQKLT